MTHQHPPSPPHTNAQDTGLFGVYLVAPENKLEDLAWYTLHALLKCVHQTTEEEVAYAKAQLKTNYLNSISTVAGANDVRGGVRSWWSVVPTASDARHPSPPPDPPFLPLPPPPPPPDPIRSDPHHHRTSGGSS